MRQKKQALRDSVAVFEHGIDALNKWVEALKGAGIKDGPLFLKLRNGKITNERLSESDVTRICKKYVKLIGLDPEEIDIP